MSDDIPPDIGKLPDDPFRQYPITIHKVSAAAGKEKSRTAIRVTVAAAKRGRKTIIAAPTNFLINELIAFAKECDSNIKIYEITSEEHRSQYRVSDGSVAKRILKFIEIHAMDPRGFILFITHEGYFRVTAFPPETKAFDIIIDEEPDTILTHEPFKLRHSHWNLTSFIDINAVPTTLAERKKQIKPPPEFTTFKDEMNEYHNDEKRTIKRKGRINSDLTRLGTWELLITNPDTPDAVKERAKREKLKLEHKRAVWEEWLKNRDAIRLTEEAKSYYLLTAKEDFKQEDSLMWIKLRQNATNADDIYRYFAPLPQWLLEDGQVFTAMAPYNAMTVKPDKDNPVEDRGQITVIGFRRPDKLAAFNKVTIMSALFEHTFTYMVWEQLGVKFVPSDEIDVSDEITDLGKRNLHIYWLYDQGWSKYIREASGGITPVLELIKQSGVIGVNEKVCVLINKADGGPDNPQVVRDVFPNAILLPHKSRGLNRYRHHTKLMFLVSLNPYTTDIEWLATVLGINTYKQRIARTGQEAYQTAMRINLRDTEGTEDIHLIVVDKDVAEFIAPLFAPASQVFVHEIDSHGVIKRKGRGKGGGPKPIFDKPMTNAERVRRHRERKRLQKADQS